jgi:hypothetical protein
MLTALVAVVMPYDWMNAIHQRQGLGELPHVPIIGYLTRSISALYALHGALLVFLAGDVRRFLPVVRFLALVDSQLDAGGLDEKRLLVLIKAWRDVVSTAWTALGLDAESRPRPSVRIKTPPLVIDIRRLTGESPMRPSRTDGAPPEK